MNCRRVEQLLSDHLEARLSEREADAVAQHLSDCPACRQRQETFAALGKQAVVEPVPSLHVKGKREPVTAYLLHGIERGSQEASVDSDDE